MSLAVFASACTSPQLMSSSHGVVKAVDDDSHEVVSSTLLAEVVE